MDLGVLQACMRAWRTQAPLEKMFASASGYARCYHPLKMRGNQSLIEYGVRPIPVGRPIIIIR